MSILHFIAVVMLLPVVILMAVRHLGRRRVSVPSCARCFYNVTGLTSSVCPECGANLNEVGVLEPGGLKPLGRVAYVSIWTAVVGAIALLISPPLLRLVPPLWSVSGQRVFGLPGSRLYQSVTISADHTFRRAEDGRAPVLTVTLKTDNSTSVMEVDYTNMESQFTDASGTLVTRALRFDQEEPVSTLVDWFKANAIVLNKTVRTEIAQIAEALEDHAVREPDRERQRRLFASAVNGHYFVARPHVQQTMSKTGFSSGGVFARRADSTKSGPKDDPWPLRILILSWLVTWFMGSLAMWMLVGRKLRVSAADPRIASGIAPVSATEGELLCEARHLPSASMD